MGSAAVGCPEPRQLKNNPQLIASQLTALAFPFSMKQHANPPTGNASSWKPDGSFFLATISLCQMPPSTTPSMPRRLAFSFLFFSFLFFS